MDKIARELILIAMSVSDAEKIMGISSGADADEIKRRYRKLSLKNHPDRGGDERTMALINEAYETLDDSSRNQSEWKRKTKEWEEQDQNYEKREKENLDRFMSVFKGVIDDYKRHLGKYSKVSGVKPKFKSSKNGWFGNVTFDLDGDDYASVEIGHSVSYKDEGQDDIHYESYIYTGRKKTRLQKSRYNSAQVSFVLNPDKVFPSRRLKKIFGSSEDQKMKPKDFIALLQRKFEMEYSNKDTYSVPLGGKFRMILYRGTFMRMPYWGVNGIYNKFKRVEMGPTVTISEDSKGFLMIEALVKDAKRKYNNEIKEQEDADKAGLVHASDAKIAKELSRIAKLVQRS